VEIGWFRTIPILAPGRSKKMNVSKQYGETAAEEADPIEVIKSAQVARAKQIQGRAGVALMVAVLGIIAVMMLRLFDTPYSASRSFYDSSLLQRIGCVWLCMFFACFAISILAKYRLQYAGFFSAKARTPAVLIGTVGLCIVIFVAVGFFFRPYTGARLNWTPEAGYFLGGWFLVVWGFVFRK
jgi:hypothetical protein